VIKLLLLGAGASGKSTLYKQMITLYGKGISEKEVAGYRPIIHSNVIHAMQTLCTQSVNYGGVSPSLQAKANELLELKEDTTLTPQIAHDIALLWDDNGIQKTFLSRRNFQLIDSATYFFERLQAISAPDYIPDPQDVLRSRAQTSGVMSSHVTISGKGFQLLDVGGQRAQRSRWIHYFEGVTSVMFVAAVSEYDQVVEEDDTTNRVVEALKLFDEICNSRWFTDTSMILFLNKRDLFAEKLPRVPVSTYFPEYKGDNSEEDAGRFFAGLFKDRNKNKGKKVYVHFTCATDRKVMQKIFDGFKDIIIRQNTADSGLE